MTFKIANVANIQDAFKLYLHLQMILNKLLYCHSNYLMGSIVHLLSWSTFTIFSMMVV